MQRAQDRDATGGVTNGEDTPDWSSGNQSQGFSDHFLIPRIRGHSHERQLRGFVFATKNRQVEHD